MMEPEEEQKKKSLAERLPRIGRLSQVILIVGILAIILIALYMVGDRQATQQEKLTKDILTLQRSVSAGTQEAPKDKMEAQIRQLEAETEAARATFPEPEQLTEVMDRLIKLAKRYDIEVVSTRMTLSQKKLKIGDRDVPYDVCMFTLSLQGMAPDFQNFLLDLDGTAPTSVINQVTIKLATTDNERDAASLTMDVYCY